MKLTISLQGESYGFRDLKQLFAAANEERSGDILAGLGAEHAKERIAAKLLLADLTLADIRSHPMLPPEEDEISRVIEEGVDEQAYQRIRHWTVGDLRDQLLSQDSAGVQDISKGLNSEMVAAAAKLMSNLDLIQAAAKCEVITRCNTVLGGRGRLGSRAQPNHPTDDPKGMKASIYEALSYGVGDTVIGINPVIDTTDNILRLFHETMEVIHRWNIPTQNSVLAHVTTQMRAIEKGAPADLIFQSLAGTQSGNDSFGINLRLLEEADQLIQESGTAKGENRWYFETGQGSELSAGAHHGIDQVTLESRCYGLAKRFKPFMLNTVVGFIGPEYLYDSKQVIRAGLEDHFMGKIQGLPMGVDVCYTNHMRADQNDMDNLAVLLAAAGVNFIIGVPMADDCMLNYQSTSFHDIATLRELLRLQPGAEFAAWAESMGILQDGRLTALAGDPTRLM
ncbi:ethanolamine ammonia-lyase subunit EutB [Paenibacillus sp. P32E]|uniref:ethanolamine ammonia-lyase subunit EutB n=1 Tax=Paenibacillus sp. P32E TaxID=1349434 RepID=UPI00093C7461|nr:ethanolamine ammonia-lyase subunit EutB [Paenibacillus sp. P32E]OKP82588.1 ethanolamine ammonia-lyase [Paenibacillus sp. P32E]